MLVGAKPKRTPDIVGGDARPLSKKPPSPADAAGIDRPQLFDAKEPIREWMPYPGCGDIVTHTYHALVELGEQATFEDQPSLFRFHSFMQGAWLCWKTHFPGVVRHRRRQSVTSHMHWHVRETVLPSGEPAPLSVGI